MSGRSQRNALWLIVAAALLLRLALVFLLDTWVIGDEWEFGYEAGRIARSLALGEGFSSPFPLPSGPTAWLMPGYPALVALIFTMAGVYSSKAAVAIIALNCLASALCCLPIFLISRRVFGIMTGYLAACGIALYPPSIWHAINTIWATSLVALLALLLVYAFYILSDQLKMGRVALFGFSSGVAVLVSPVVLPFVGCIGIWLLFRPERTLFWRLSAVMLLSVATVAPLTPWLARNYLRFDRPFLRSNFGLELKLGNSSAAWEYLTGASDVDPLYIYHPSQSEQEFEHFTALGETAYLRQASADAWGYIESNPWKALRLTLRRVQIFWLSDLGARNDWVGRLNISVSLSWLKKLCYLMPLPFMLLGITVALKRRLPVGPLLMFLAVTPFVYYLTHVSERYRFIVEAIIVMFAAFGVSRLIDEAICRIDRAERTAS